MAPAAACLNGSGISTDNGIIQKEGYCNNPPSGCQGNLYRSNIENIIPACGGNAIGNGDLAVYGHNNVNNDLSCGVRICIFTQGIHYIRDKCRECDDNQIDHFIYDGRCRRIDSLGDYITIKIY